MLLYSTIWVSQQRNEEAVISPSWSIHSASATHAYTFIWGMVGENQDFDDMDDVDMKDLR